MDFNTISDDHRKLNLNWDRVNIYVSRYKPGTSFEVSITRRQPRRSDPLRKYYFSAVLPPFMNHLGYERDEEDLFHRQLKIVYFNIKPDKKGIYRNVPSVFGNESDLPVSAKKKFVDWTIRKAAIEDIYIEDPR